MKFKHLLVACLTALALPAASAMADVTLSFSSISRTVDKFLNPDTTVTLNLLTTASEQTVGIQYYLTAKGNASGHFTLADRIIGTSPYNDPNFDDLTVEASPGNLLDPTNDFDLGGTTTNNVIASGATIKVADLKFHVLPDATIGTTYVIETTNSLWSKSDFTDQPLDQFHQASLSILVVPEPGTLGLAGIGTIGLMMRRRRK